VLEVRAVLVAVPRQLRQRLRPELARVVGEPDHRQVVVRKLVINGSDILSVFKPLAPCLTG
jgi:hypothetical protein